MFGASRKLDQLAKHLAAGDVQREVDTRGSDGANLFTHLIAIVDRLSTKDAKTVVGGRAPGADHARTTLHRELNRSASSAWVDP